MWREGHYGADSVATGRVAIGGWYLLAVGWTEEYVVPDFVMLAVGFATLILGGELLVRGAVALARRAGISPLMIGLAVIGFGTSAPELVTSVQASLAGSPGIAIGNIVGSSISNILLILGLGALMTPIVVASAALKRDGLVLLAVMAAFTGIAFVTDLNRVVGAAFLIALVSYLLLAYRQERTASAAHGAAFEVAEAYGEIRAPSMPLRPVAMTLGGLAVLMLGGHLLVEGAVGMARAHGVSETVIGLTIVAIGTSLPEFVATIIAAFRQHSDMALGNILGSNIYNLLGIGGVTGVLAPTPFPEQVRHFDNAVMLAATALVLLFALSGWRISRAEGAVLIVCYVLYLLALPP